MTACVSLSQPGRGTYKHRGRQPNMMQTYIHTYIHPHIPTVRHTCIHTYIHTYDTNRNAYIHTAGQADIHTCIHSQQFIQTAILTYRAVRATHRQS